MKEPRTRRKEPRKDNPITVKPALEIASNLHYEIASDKQVKFTRARAFEFLELNTFEGERQVNERHVQFLYNQWSTGRFMWEHVLIGVCQFKDKFYRINGQHTCWLRVNINEDHFAKLGYVPEVREITYKVDHEENLRGLYATFDQNKNRTAGHIITALLVGTPTTSDIWSSMINKLGQAMRLWLFEDSEQRCMATASDVAALIEQKYDKVFQLVGLFQQSHYQDCGWGRRAPVIAAQFSTFSVNVEKSREFWEPVLSGLGLDHKSDPRFQLRKFMETHRQSMGTELKNVSAEDSYRVCLSAWNKWRKGESCLTGLRTTETRPKVSK